MKRLSGEIAIVTGSSSRIGKARRFGLEKKMGLAQGSFRGSWLRL